MGRHGIAKGVVLALLGAGAGACRAPVEAPEELDSLSSYLYRNWHMDDERLLSEGVANLEKVLDQVDLAGPMDERTWALSTLTPDDVVDIDRPDRPLEACLGVALARESEWPVVDHARLQMEPDQTPTEPTAQTYTRDLVAPDDGQACFPAGDCDVVQTVNMARRANFIMSVDFVLLKDFKWVTLPDGREAVVGRSWFEDSFAGDAGNAMLYQSYAVDVWLERPNGSTWRLQSLWSESDVGSFGDNIVRQTTLGAIDGIFRAGDDTIASAYHGE